MLNVFLFRSIVKATNKALQEPSSSVPGKIWGWLDIFFIALSVVAMVTETNPYIKERVDTKGSLEQRIAFGVESATVCFFTLDVLIRFIVSDQRLAFARSPATWLDIVTVAPYYFELFVDATRFKGLKVLRMARVVRVLKLIKKNKRLLLIAYVMSHSLGELSLLIIVWAMCITVAGCVFYYCEVGLNNNVNSGKSYNMLTLYFCLPSISANMILIDIMKSKFFFFNFHSAKQNL